MTLDRPCALLALAALLLPALPAPAQPPATEQPASQFEEEVFVTEVLLDVLVTDRQGRVIIGLDKGDFVVEEDGQPVDLTSVTFYSNSHFVQSSLELAERGLDVDQIPRDRYFILFFHDQRRTDSPEIDLLGQQMDAARQSRRWVKEEMLSSDWVAVVSYDEKLKVHQDFSHDKKAILKAIEGFVVGKDPGANWPSRRPAAEGGPSLLTRLPAGKELGKQTGTIYEGIQTLAEAAGAVQGRKNLLLFTIGFGIVSPFGQFKPDYRYYTPMTQALNDNNLAVYTVDLVPSGVARALDDGLNQLALDTGGRYFFNFANFITPLRQVSEDNTGYYLLSYQARHPRGETGYQKVTVRAKNPAFKVSAREGYLYGGATPAAEPGGGKESR